MTDTADRLADLLHEPCIEHYNTLRLADPDRRLTQHGPDAHAVLAARLIAAGVTLAALAAPLDEQGWQPDVVLPEGTFPPRDRRTRHATPAPLESVRGDLHGSRLDRIRWCVNDNPGGFTEDFRFLLALVNQHEGLAAMIAAYEEEKP